LTFGEHYNEQLAYSRLERLDQSRLRLCESMTMASRLAVRESERAVCIAL
jgi:hypothetical protein